MKKIIASGLAACAMAVVPGVALAAPAFASPHDFGPQQIHAVLQDLGQQAVAQDAGQQQAPAQDADQQPAATAQDATQDPAAAQSPNKQREFQIAFAALGLNNNAQLVQLRGPADQVFGGGHSQIGQKEVGEFDFIANPGGLPGIVNAKWNLLDANNQVVDTVDMDMVVLQAPNQPPKLDLRNIRIEQNTVQTSGVQKDVLGNVIDRFFRNT
jgi:hypothetical protein